MKNNIKKINILSYLLFGCIIFSYGQKNSDIIEKEFKITGITRMPMFFNNPIFITAIENKTKKKCCLKKEKDYVYNIFIDIDSVKKYANNFDDFLLKIKTGNIYTMEIEAIFNVKLQDGLFLKMERGLIYEDSITGIIYNIDKVYFLKDITLSN